MPLDIVEYVIDLPHCPIVLLVTILGEQVTVGGALETVTVVAATSVQPLFP